MASSMEIAGVSVATIALVIALICLIWIIIRECKLRWPFGTSPDSKWNMFRGGF